MARLLYVVIGDLERNGQLENYAGGAAPDDTSVILRVRQDGTAAPGNPFTPYCARRRRPRPARATPPAAATALPLAVAKYYAYGVRNSFGLAIDPRPGGCGTPRTARQFRRAEPRRARAPTAAGGRSWGPASQDPQGTSDLWNMPGAGSTYSDPEFSWNLTISPTGVVLPSGSSLGHAYDNKLLVGAFNNAQLYALPLNAARTGFDFSGFPDLADRVADNHAEANQLRHRQRLRAEVSAGSPT